MALKMRGGGSSAMKRRCFSAGTAAPRPLRVAVVAQAQNTKEAPAKAANPLKKGLSELTGLGDALGPIGLTIGASVQERENTNEKPKQQAASNGRGETLADKAGVSLGPIALTFGEAAARPAGSDDDSGEASTSQPQSIARLTTEEWRRKYEQDGAVDLWVEEEFNAGSRLVGGRAVHWGGVAGFRSGEGPTSGDVAQHKVTVYNHYADQVVEVEVPEDTYVLWEAERAGLELPYACRMGCCTACAVRIKEGEMYQPEALGISQELKEQGYALMCVAFPLSECVLETVPEDEVYDLQFGHVFEQAATDPNGEFVERDDYALEIANMDE